MWYKIALTEIEPTGQLVLPNMSGGKFNLDQLRFDLSEEDNKYTLNVYVPGSKIPLDILNLSIMKTLIIYMLIWLQLVKRSLKNLAKIMKCD